MQTKRQKNTAILAGGFVTPAVLISNNIFDMITIEIGLSRDRFYRNQIYRKDG